MRGQEPRNHGLSPPAPTTCWPSSATAVAANGAPARSWAARAYDFAALNLAGLCEVVPYAHDLAWTRDSTYLSKSGCKLPGVSWYWHGMAWSQQLELLSVLDLEEHCSYPVHARLQPSKGSRTCRRARRAPGSPRAEVVVMLQLLDEALDRGPPLRHRGLRRGQPLRLFAHGRGPCRNGALNS